jgi:hypothetical protein
MTTVDEIRTLVDAYRLWLRDKTKLKSVHADWVEITTPFLDRHNDFIQIYVKRENGAYRITDDGNTIRDLEISGSPINSPKRKDLLRVALNGLAVQENAGELIVRASKSRGVRDAGGIRLGRCQPNRVQASPPDSSALAGLNDREKLVSSNVIDALEEYEIQPILWSQRDEGKSQLLL